MQTAHARTPWPTLVPRAFTPRAKIAGNPLDHVHPAQRADWIATEKAKRRALLDPVATGLTPTYNEAFYTNTADHSAVASTASEASLLAGTNSQPFIPSGYLASKNAFGAGIRIRARGVLSTTGTPTIIFTVRLGETSGSSYLSGTAVGVNAAITTQSGVTNKQWELCLELICTVPAIGSGNTTLSGAGWVMSPGGFAAPYTYALQPTTPDTATWTSVLNANATQYINLSATWSASSASNTITCKQLIAEAFG